jgi:hypothetical protein
MLDRTDGERSGRHFLSSFKALLLFGFGMSVQAARAEACGEDYVAADNGATDNAEGNAGSPHCEYGGEG